MWECKIKKVENGYIFSYLIDTGEINSTTGEPLMNNIEEVIECEFDDEIEAIKKLLERISEFFGYIYDKYSENNLNITFDKKGHKLE